jgi:hypothetical protein
MDQNRNRFHPVLPRLKKDSRVRNFQNAGQWDVRKQTELEDLSGSLDVERVEFEVNSIPDMWARPLLFEMALFDRHHALHPRVRGEWRGLLAVIALRELRVISMSVRSVEIPQVNADGGTAMVSQPSAPDFLNALSKLTPRKTLAPDTSWHKLYIFLLRNRPIGITSPTTLVCTATECLGRITTVPWSDGRFLTDPTAQISYGEKEALASWLNTLKDSLLHHEGLQQTKEWNTLDGLIDDYITDLGGAPERAASLSDMSLQMTAGFFSYLDRAVKNEGDGDPKRSHVRLLPSRPGEPKPSILVVDRTIADQWRMQEHDIIVYGTIPLETTIPFSGMGGQRNQIAGQNLNEAEWWTPKDFFTKKLFVVEQKDAFPGAMKAKIPGADVLRYQNQQITPILPIEKRLIDYLNINDLSQRLSFEQSNDGIIARLRLRLSGPDGNGREFEIRQEYRFKENEVISLGESVPVLEVWPNFTIRDGKWKTYYTYYSAEGASNTFTAEPYTPGAPTPEVQPFTNNRGEVERIITRAELYPEVMVCKAPVANVETNSMELIPAGVMLIEHPKVAELQRNTVNIGIDFGTTSTNVYIKEGNSDPRPIVFEDHFLQVAAPGSARPTLYDYFLPGEPVPAPFLTLFNDFNLQVNPQQLRPLLDGHIYFLQDYKKFDVNSKKAGEIATDLKWSSKNINQVRARAFLEQICLQSAAEAVLGGASEVIWAYSFPTAFSNAVIRQSFPRIWGQVTGACSTATGLTQPPESPRSKTESEASALFFRRHDKASTSMGTVCIDIGGSTSDIAIWQDDELRWQSSVRLAGRDIFLDFLHSRPEVLQLFGLDISNLKSATGNQSAFYAQSDALLEGAGKSILELLPNHVANEQVQQLIQFIALGLSGLFYYVGLVLNYLTSKEIYRKQMPDIYVGGNGAKMFHWLDVGSYSMKSPINELFKKALLQASGFASTEIFKLKISSRPKAEAAYGLVCDEDLKINENNFEEVLAGEKFVENGQEKNWDQTIKAERLTSGLRAPQTLERLNDFLQVFNAYAKSRGAVISPFNPDAIAMRDVVSRLDQTLGSFKDYSDPNNVQLEPVFILALKHLLAVKKVS